MSGPAPSGIDPDAWGRLTARPVAHRGLWGQDAPENSLAAFEAAAKAGYGIELDVQLSADGVAVVFHDDRLERLTGAHGRIAERTAAQLAEVRLCQTEETVPTLAEALECIGRRTLALIELKVLGGEEGLLEQAVCEALAGYGGPTAVLSFNPKTVGWFADHYPQALRGLYSTGYHDATQWTLTPEQRRGLLELDHARVARPHFLSLGLDMLPSPSAAAMRAAGLPVLGWTVRSPRQRSRLAAHCDNYMFEGFAA